MKPLSIGIVLVFATSVSQANCVRVKGEDFELHTNEIGSADLEWEARIENECRQVFDADMTVQLLDAKGREVYSLRNMETLGFGESRKVGKRVYVPSHIVGEVEKIDIQVEERKREY